MNVTTAQKRACTKALKDAMVSAGVDPSNAMFVYSRSQADGHTYGNDYPQAQKAALEAAGYTVEVSEHWSFPGNQHCGYNFMVRSPKLFN